MPASDPSGDMSFWDAGFPFGGIKNSTNDAGSMDFWDAGFPMVWIFPTSTTSIKTINGLAYASVKTFNNVALASVKTINGLA